MSQHSLHSETSTHYSPCWTSLYSSVDMTQEHSPTNYLRVVSGTHYSVLTTQYSVLSTAHSSSSTASSAGCTLDEQHRHVYVAVPMSECIQSFLLLLSFIPIVTISCQCFTAYFVLLMDATKLLFLVHTGYFTAIRKARPVKTLYISTINTFP